VIATLAIVCGFAFFAGLVAGAIVNYVSYRRWLNSTRPERKGWYHTWNRS
jgi:hypothetical protein